MKKEFELEIPLFRKISLIKGVVGLISAGNVSTACRFACRTTLEIDTSNRIPCRRRLHAAKVRQTCHQLHSAIRQDPWKPFMSSAASWPPRYPTTMVSMALYPGWNQQTRPSSNTLHWTKVIRCLVPALAVVVAFPCRPLGYWDVLWTFRKQSGRMYRNIQVESTMRRRSESTSRHYCMAREG